MIDSKLVDLIDHIRTDPQNAGYLLLLGNYGHDEIRRTLDWMDAASAKGEQS